MTLDSENSVITNLIFCFYALSTLLYMGDPHDQIILVFCEVSKAADLTSEQFRFLIQALSTLEVIYHGRCVTELM